MKLKHSQSKRSRINYGFRGVTTDSYLWFSEEDYKLKPYEECKKEFLISSVSFESVKTVKAFKRWIKKHKEIPKGTILKLCSHWVNCDVYFTIK